MTSCSAIKAGGKEEGSELYLELWSLSSHVNVLHHKALPSWQWLSISLSTGSTELTQNFLLAHEAFALPTRMSLSQAMSFLTFTLLILSPIP